MKNANYYFLVCSILLFGCSPSFSPYTQKLHDKYEWSEADLKKVQFYLSDDIVLRRKTDSGKAEIKNGEIKIIDGSRYELVKFKRGTPGVLLFMPKDNRLAISFENKNDLSAYLMFGPNPEYSNQYVLLASDWDKRVGTVTYLGKKWETSAQHAFSGLEISLRSLDSYNSNQRIVGGRKIE